MQELVKVIETFLSKGEELLSKRNLYIMSTKRISGIYIITNKVNGKIYIGESLDIYRRWHKEHIPQLRKGCHYNTSLQEDFNKYGEENFDFDILERYSEDNPIMTKARILILESYFLTAFKDSGISTYNSENTLVEILRGNKIPPEGNVVIDVIVHTLKEFNIKDCEGFAYFDKKKTLKSILSEHIKTKSGETITSLLNEFISYVNNNGEKEDNYIYRHSFTYTLNGKINKIVIEEIQDDTVKDIERLAILFSEHKMQEEIKKKTTTTSIYIPISNGEVKFSLLFKEFSEEGILPSNYDYQKVREYLVGLDIISIKDMESNGASKRVTFATDNALNKGILRIVGSKLYGSELTYSYVFTKYGVDYMRNIFTNLDEKTRIGLFSQGDIA